ncbi:transferase hexapeptide domain-containing protein [Colletotrichum acutatum]
MSSNKRHSMLPAVSNQGPRPPVSFSSSLTVADSAILVGTHSITIQSESVLHPRSKLETTNGSILIGRRCIIHERAHIGKVGDDDASGGISLGDYVTVEVGAIIEAGGTDIGTDTVVGVRSRIGNGAVIGKVGAIFPSDQLGWPTDYCRTARSRL